MTPQPVSANFDLPSGTMLGKYEVIKLLATGGMAEIYLARVRGTAGFEKLCVIKRILPNVARDPSFVQMFLDEARLAATLQHPNIADVYEVGEIGGTPYFAMEFLHGQDVRSIRMTARKRREPVPLAVALAVLHGTASALDYAHERRGPDGTPLGIVHRDVSPSNIIVSYEGAIKLIDFGIARASGRTHTTRTGTLKGKIPYMSPEQCRGGAIDKRSDLFSLGVVMYELTVGQRPFRGETDFAIMDQIVNSQAVPPSQARAGYPADLEAITMRLLAHRPEDRYQSAEEMLHDLDAFIGQHRLWLAAKPLSRFMQTLFADKVAAWNAASNDVQTIAQIASATITSNSASSELVTPPSAFPALVPAAQQFTETGPFALVDEHEHEGETNAREVRPETAPRRSRPVDVVPEAPDFTSSAAISLRPRRKLGVLVGGLLAAAAMAGGAYLALNRGSDSGESGTARSAEVPPHEAAGSARVTEAGEGDGTDEASDPAEASDTAEVVVPTDPVPDDTKTDDSKTDDSRTADNTRTESKTKSSKHTSKKQAGPKDKPAETTPPPPPEPKKPEEKWDQNSPFLPPSR